MKVEHFYTSRKIGVDKMENKCYSGVIVWLFY